ncbi:MAG: AmmeMemoRadiSam system radical SAM enzyme [Acidobacteriota bacterium]
MPQAQPLAEILSELARDGELFEKLPGDKVRCFACGHRCLILEGLPGICKVRFNRGGSLRVPGGYVGALQVDPIEKKPFFHALPGSLAMSFGMLGCDFHCGYCQNWITSQAIRDPGAVSMPERVAAAELVSLALERGARIVASTYNEPLITAEWAMEVLRPAVQAGLIGAFISNGNATAEVLDYIRPYVRLYKVDLKSFRQSNYRELGGRLEVILDAIQMLRQKDFWVEVVTLVVPGFNDSDEEFGNIARFLASVSPDIPWHVTAFRQNYKMTEPDDTPASTLLRAVHIGEREGLRFVYAGNLPGQVGSYENTRCPGCGALLIERHGFLVSGFRIAPGGACPECGRDIPGLWPGEVYHPQAAPPASG